MVDSDASVCPFSFQHMFQMHSKGCRNISIWPMATGNSNKHSTGLVLNVLPWNYSYQNHHGHHPQKSMNEFKCFEGQQFQTSQNVFLCLQFSFQFLVCICCILKTLASHMLLLRHSTTHILKLMLIFWRRLFIVTRNNRMAVSLEHIKYLCVICTVKTESIRNEFGKRNSILLHER